MTFEKYFLTFLLFIQTKKTKKKEGGGGKEVLQFKSSCLKEQIGFNNNDL